MVRRDPACSLEVSVIFGWEQAVCGCSWGGCNMSPRLTDCSQCSRDGMWNACLHCMLWLGVGLHRSTARTAARLARQGS